MPRKSFAHSGCARLFIFCLCVLICGSAAPLFAAPQQTDFQVGIAGAGSTCVYWPKNWPERTPEDTLLESLAALIAVLIAVLIVVLPLVYYIRWCRRKGGEAAGKIPEGSGGGEEAAGKAVGASEASVAAGPGNVGSGNACSGDTCSGAACSDNACSGQGEAAPGNAEGEPEDVSADS